MKYDLYLYDKSNQKEEVMELDLNDFGTVDMSDSEKLENMIFNYEDGNYSCDCNRSIQMYGYSNKYECGNSKIKVKITDKSKNIIYTDTD